MIAHRAVSCAAFPGQSRAEHKQADVSEMQQPSSADNRMKSSNNKSGINTATKAAETSLIVQLTWSEAMKENVCWMLVSKRS